MHPWDGHEVHPMWSRDVHPPAASLAWERYATTDERGEPVTLCFHCGRTWPCSEALILGVTS